MENKIKQLKDLLTQADTLAQDVMKQQPGSVHALIARSRITAALESAEKITLPEAAHTE